jgi:hypothetical protein
MMLVMEATGISETSVNLFQTSLRNSLEDSRHSTHRRENLKSYVLYF